MNIVVLYNDPGTDATVEDLDVLVQRDAVVASLRTRNHIATPLGCTLNLQATQLHAAPVGCQSPAPRELHLCAPA